MSKPIPKIARLFLAILVALVFVPGPLNSQSGTGILDFSARITPTDGRPEPVRQFTFYVLTRSYADISKEISDGDKIPTRDEFIETLKISPELRTWLKGHDILDLTMPGVDKVITPDDIIHVPEFLAAYQRSNSGGVTKGLPKPKYTEAEKTDHPDKYEQHRQEYLSTLKKFIQANPGTVSGIELEMEGMNPQAKWAQIQADHKKHILRLAPDVAQTKYLAAKTDSDLEGHGAVVGLAPGNYWITTLNLGADAGDLRLRWDVPFSIRAGQTTHLDLTNLNGTDWRDTPQ
jgi:hypothetical protein